MNKYCRSFFKGEPDPYLETAQHYDLKRQDLTMAIDMHLDNINTMAEVYRNEVSSSSSVYATIKMFHETTA